MLKILKVFRSRRSYFRNTFVSPQESLVAINETVRSVESACSHIPLNRSLMSNFPNTQISRSIIYPSHPLQMFLLWEDSCFFWNQNLQFWEMREVVFFGGNLEATIAFFGPDRQFFKQNKMKHHSLLPKPH